MGKIVVFLLVIVTVACAPSQQQYEQEAAAFCALYAPGKRLNTPTRTALVNYSQLNPEIREVIKSEAFLDIFKQLSEADYTDFYGAIQPEISRLIGKEWQCDDARNYYAIKWERQDVSSTSSSTTFTVTKDGYILFKDRKMAYADITSIKNELMKINNKNETVNVKVPETFKEEELDQLLVPFREAGILKLSISYY